MSQHDFSPQAAEAASPLIVRPRRSGESWTEQEFAELVGLIRDQLSVEEISTRLGRTLPAVTGHMSMLVPPETGLKGQRARQWLLETLGDKSRRGAPEFDWRATLTHRYAAQGRRFWTVGDDEVTRSAWRASTPLPELSAHLGVSEPMLVRRILALGLAFDEATVVRRLGCTPGGSVDVRHRLSVNDRTRTVHVVSLVGPAGRHLSLHGSAAEARAELTRLRAASHGEPTRWWISARTPGGGNVGRTASGGDLTVTIVDHPPHDIDPEEPAHADWPLGTGTPLDAALAALREFAHSSGVSPPAPAREFVGTDSVDSGAREDPARMFAALNSVLGALGDAVRAATTAAGQRLEDGRGPYADGPHTPQTDLIRQSDLATARLAEAGSALRTCWNIVR